MGMTMTQKILAAHAGLDCVTEGQLIEAKLDIVMANDITGPMALPIFRQMHQMEHWQTETRLKYIWINLWQTAMPPT